MVSPCPPPPTVPCPQAACSGLLRHGAELQVGPDLDFTRVAREVQEARKLLHIPASRSAFADRQP